MCPADALASESASKAQLRAGKTSMESNELEDKRFLLNLGQHLVAMCGSYVYLDDQGKQMGDPIFYSYTGTVFEILGKWCIGTAGHCLKSIKDATDNPGVRVEAQILADYFGPNVTDKTPIPFKPLEEGYGYLDEDGLDFGFVALSDLWKRNLERNGIVPFTSRQWNFPADFAFEHYGIVGFPDEYTGKSPFARPTSTTGHVKPTLVSVERMSDDTTKPFAQFKGKILDKGDQESIKGMSGGPIFGFFREGGEVKYLLVALQSWWDERSKVFATPIPTIMRSLEQNLREYQRRAQPQNPDRSNQ
jgi:hypothetical protein